MEEPKELQLLISGRIESHKKYCVEFFAARNVAENPIISLNIFPSAKMYFVQWCSNEMSFYGFSKIGTPN